MIRFIAIVAAIFYVQPSAATRSQVRSAVHSPKKHLHSSLQAVLAKTKSFSDTDPGSSSSSSASAGWETDQGSGSGYPDLSGYTGTVTRKNVIHLTAAEKKQFIEAVDALKQEYHEPPNGDSNPAFPYSTYDYLVYEHSNAGNHFANANFIPWHSAFILKFEKHLQRISQNRSMALPYWDFSDPWHRDAVFAVDMMGGNSSLKNHHIDSGPFATTNKHWNISVCTAHAGIGQGNDYTPRRCLGCSNTPVHHGELPSLCAWAQSLSMNAYTTPPYDGNVNGEVRLTNFAKRMHDRVHAFLRLTIAHECDSSGDPIFWLLHAFIDKWWRAWQKMHHPNGDDLWGYRPRDRNYQDIYPNSMAGQAPNATLYRTGYTIYQMLNPNVQPYTYESNDQFDRLVAAVSSDLDACAMAQENNQTGTGSMSRVDMSDYQMCTEECEALLPGAGIRSFGPGGNFNNGPAGKTSDGNNGPSSSSSVSINSYNSAGSSDGSGFANQEGTGDQFPDSLIPPITNSSSSTGSSSSTASGSGSGSSPSGSGSGSPGSGSGSSPSGSGSGSPGSGSGSSPSGSGSGSR